MKVRKEARQAFQEAFRAARKDKGWTQIHLAGLLNTVQPQIARWENGASIPEDPAVMEKIKEVLGIDAEAILTGRDDQIPNDIVLFPITGEINPLGVSISDTSTPFETSILPQFHIGLYDIPKSRLVLMRVVAPMNERYRQGALVFVERGATPQDGDDVILHLPGPVYSLKNYCVTGEDVVYLDVRAAMPAKPIVHHRGYTTFGVVRAVHG